MDAEDDLVAAVLAAIEAGGPDEVRLLLHPYLHWTTPDGRTVRGRVQVLALLGRDYPVAADRATGVDVELRDGQIYRWQPRRDV